VNQTQLLFVLVDVNDIEISDPPRYPAPPGARATQGVVKLDIARDLLDPDSFVATGVYEDGAALERQESAPEVHLEAGQSHSPAW
jgi:hypothetical protein